LALTKEQKEQIVAKYVEKFSKSQALILADYRGMTVANLTSLRSRLRESGNSFLVVKNTLARIALERAGKPVPSDVFTGPVAIGLCYGEIAPVAKAFNEAAQDTKLLTLRGAILGSRLVDAEGTKQLANMPPREVVLGEVLGRLQSPLSSLVSVLAGPLRGLAYVLQARSDQLAAAG